ncbi:unnamed protein product [marine sediment metagenome]|uniref:Uncharacterized protein n=1 Tax=marine sediment metagenome TaxID=412755 RepID=X1KRV7_9ZZZZ
MPDPKKNKGRTIKVKGRVIISDVRGHRVEIDNPEIRVGQKVHLRKRGRLESG